MRRDSAFNWWKKGTLDGKDCARKRRHRYFQVYKEKALLSLSPSEEMLGVCEYVYTRAFRVGYDAEKEARVRRNTFLPRPRKRRKLQND